MKVFISWSGEQSRETALLLREWLPEVIQSIKPWMSEKDIDRGAMWFGELGKQLEDHDFGIICLTRENSKAPWILFESGALMNSLTSKKVCSLLVDLQHTDVEAPLSMFNNTRPNNAEMYGLIETLNKLSDPQVALPVEKLKSSFDRCWPDFVQKLEIISAKIVNRIPEESRSETDLLEEVLETVRLLENRSRPTANLRKESVDKLVAAMMTNPISQPNTWQQYPIPTGIFLGDPQVAPAGPLPLRAAETDKPA